MTRRATLVIDAVAKNLRNHVDIAVYGVFFEGIEAFLRSRFERFLVPVRFSSYVFLRPLPRLLDHAGDEVWRLRAIEEGIYAVGFLSLPYDVGFSAPPAMP